MGSSRLTMSLPGQGAWDQALDHRLRPTEHDLIESHFSIGILYASGLHRPLSYLCN